jgi:prepilin-type processing-associated H-X9-DG protein
MMGDASTVDSGWPCYNFYLANAASPDSGCKGQAVANIGFGDGHNDVQVPSTTPQLVNRSQQ